MTSSTRSTLRRITAASAAVSAVVALSVLGVPAAHAAEPVAAPGLLVGIKMYPDGTLTTAAENPDGSGYVERRLPDGSKDQTRGHSWSPDGRKIAFQSGAGGISVENSDFTGEYGVSDGVEGFPAFTSDGATVIASAYDGSDVQFQLWSSPVSWNMAEHQNQGAMTPWFAKPTGGADRYPSVSRQTGTVVFEHSVNNAIDIWSDHGNRTAGLLIANGEQPSFSPDGTQLAFVRLVGDYLQLFVQASDGSGAATQVTTNPANHSYPKWSSDGLSLYYDSNAGGDFTSTAGHRLVLATKSDTLTPNGLIGVQQQPAPPAPAVPSTFHPLTPARLLDTRSGLGRPASGLVAGAFPLKVGGRSGVPASGVTSVVLNVTVTQTADAGHLTVWGSGNPQPTTSNLNWDRAGQTISNLVTVPLPADGSLDFYTNATTQVVADVQGYYAADATGSTFTEKAPTRILDTREALGVAARGPVSYSTFDLKVAGQNGIPADATAAVLNLTTAFTKNDAGYLEAYPAGGAVPTVSNVNWSSTGALLSGLAVVPIGADGKVSIKVNGTTDVVADVFGWFSADPAGAKFGSTSPARLLDTRSFGGPVGGGQSRSVQVTGVNGVPSGAKAVVLNVTVTGNTGAGFLETWASGTTRPPAASNVNWVAGQTIANQVVVPVGADGKVSLYVNNTTDVIVDVFGYFAA